MSDDFFMDRVFRAFDKESGGFLTQEDWVRGMSIFLKGTLDEKIKCNQKVWPCMAYQPHSNIICRGVGRWFGKGGSIDL